MIELLVVIGIIGILAALAVPAAVVLPLHEALMVSEMETVAAAVMELEEPTVADAVATALREPVPVNVVDAVELADALRLALSEALALREALAEGDHDGDCEDEGGQLALGTPDRPSTRTARMT